MSSKFDLTQMGSPLGQEVLKKDPPVMNPCPKCGALTVAFAYHSYVVEGDAMFRCRMLCMSCSYIAVGEVGAPHFQESINAEDMLRIMKEKSLQKAVTRWNSN